jgi:hypothetical protein
MFAGIMVRASPKLSCEVQTIRSINTAKKQSKQRQAGACGWLNCATLKHYHFH